MKRFLIVALMVTITVLIIIAGRARAQEAGMPVSMAGFLCDSAKDVETMLDKITPDMDFDEAKALAKSTTCSFREAAGIIKSFDGRYTNQRGDLFAVVSVTAEDKVIFTWKLLKRGTPT